MEKTIIKNAHVISPGIDLENATIVIEGKTIKSVGTKAASEKGATTVVDVKGQYVMPGFIDVHTHGALTYDFCDADPQAIFKFAEGKLEEADCCYGSCIYQPSCPIAKEIDRLIK